MRDALYLIRRKVLRGCELATKAHEITTNWAEGELYTLMLDKDRQHRLVIRADKVVPYPIEGALLLSEAAHHIRTSLDHVAFALSRPTTAAEQKNVKFPICSSSKKFAHAIKSGRLIGAAADFIKAVEAIQPYHRRKRPELNALRQIQSLDNWNKHSALAIAAASIKESVVTLEVSGGAVIVQQETFRGILKQGKIIARVTPNNAPPGAKITPNLQMLGCAAFDKTMPNEIAGLDAFTVVGEAGNLVYNKILPEFERFFS